MCSNTDEIHRYDDIINLPHFISQKYPKMSINARAAQFAPFAAVSGYNEDVNEASSLTHEKIEMDEYQKSELDTKIRILQNKIENYPEVTITYFCPDKKKHGGEYLDIIGVVKRIDGFERIMLMLDGLRIPIDDIYEINGDIFRSLM